MRRLVVLLVVACLVGLLPGCGDDPKTVARLPDATLGALRGSDRPVELRAQKGPMVVNLWANWCTPCRKELPIIQRFHEKHDDVQVLGVDWQDPNQRAAKALARTSGLTYPLVVDSKPVLRARGLPKLILVDEDGRIAYQAEMVITSLGQLERLVRTHLGVDL